MQDQNTTPEPAYLDEACRADWRAIVGYLAHDSELFDLILLSARLREAPLTLSFATENAREAAAEARVLAYLGTGSLQACGAGSCYATVILFGDGRLLDWPTLGHHECAGLYGTLTSREITPSSMRGQPRNRVSA
jgi:hypothetical protein